MRHSCSVIPAVPAGSRCLTPLHSVVGGHSTGYHMVTLKSRKLKNQTSNYVLPLQKPLLAALLAGQLTGIRTQAANALPRVPGSPSPLRTDPATRSNHKTGSEHRGTAGEPGAGCAGVFPTGAGVPAAHAQPGCSPRGSEARRGVPAQRPLGCAQRTGCSDQRGAQSGSN